MQTDMLERHLPHLLEALADEQTPEYYDDLFWQTAHTSQRSAWTIRERWLPMLEIARQPLVPHLPWRPVAVLAVLVAVLTASLLLAGARPKPPPLTGPAGNGLVAFSRDGDILTFDPRTGATAVAVTGPDVDGDPIWSPDGTRLLFPRDVVGQPGATFLMSARANGTGLRQLTPEPMTNLSSFEMSTDGRTVLLTADVKGIPALFVTGADGGTLTRLETRSIPLSAALDPTGTQVLVLGAQGIDGAYSGLYVIGVDGSALRALVEPRVDAPLDFWARWSPDGSHIAYSRWEPSALRKDLRVHVIAADGTGDRIVGHKDGAWLEAFHGWSPDGTRLTIERNVPGDPPDQAFQPVIVSVDGTTPEVLPAFESPRLWLDEWSPDGSTIQVRPEDEGGVAQAQQLWDARTGAANPAPWNATSYPAWQRVAP
jgi:hypothetical protein